MPVRWPVSNADQVQAYLSLATAACPRCRYSLRGLRDAVCPECGEKLTVLAIARPRGWARLRVSLIDASDEAWMLRLLAGLNVLLAIAIVGTAVARHGELPVLSWLAPGVLGAFFVSMHYIAAFAKYCPARYDPVERWGQGAAAFALVLQAIGLVLMWV